MTSVTLKDGETYSIEKLGQLLYTGVGSMSDSEIFMLQSSMFTAPERWPEYARAAKVLGYEKVEEYLDALHRLKEVCLRTDTPDAQGVRINTADAKFYIETSVQISNVVLWHAHSILQRHRPSKP